MEGKCPICGALEVPADSPRTVYNCGSSTYDGRPGTLLQRCEDKRLTAQDELIFGMSITHVDKDGNQKRIPPEEWEK